MTDTPQTGEPSAAEAPERQTTPFLVLQFFIFPMAIVAVCVTVFVVFGLIAAEGKGPRDYVNEVRSGGTNRRWQAAFELSKVLRSGKDPAIQDGRLAAEMISLFEESTTDDPRVRRYLALALGRLGDKRAVQALIKGLHESGAGTDVETQIYSIWALGALGDPAAVSELVGLAGSEDRDVRKAAVHALGVFSADEARAALLAALIDPVEDVRWNAAVALARRGHVGAAPVLLQMMDRAHLATVSDLTSEQREEALLQAVTAAGSVPAAPLREALLGLVGKDPNLKVREAARAALAVWRPAQE